MPELSIEFLDDQDVVIEYARSQVWIPVADTSYVRPFSARVPDRAVAFYVGGRVETRASSATGTLWFDDIRFADSDLVIEEEAINSLTVEARLRGWWL